MVRAAAARGLADSADWGVEMFWKILAAVIAVWILFAVLGFILKGVFMLVVAVVIAAGIYVLYKAFANSDRINR